MKLRPNHKTQKKQMVCKIETVYPVNGYKATISGEAIDNCLILNHNPNKIAETKIIANEIKIRILSAFLLFGVLIKLDNALTISELVFGIVEWILYMI